MAATIRLVDGERYHVTETLLGQNVELCLDLVPGLLSDRLDNPYFFGAGDVQTRVAAPWQPVWHYAAPGMQYDLTAGMAVSGNQSQMIRNFGGHEGGIAQIGRYVRKGETLKVTLWARAQNKPATIRVGLRPLRANLPEYSRANIEISACYFKPCEATLTASADDDTAVFYCVMPQMGTVYIDQIHLRAAGEGHLRRQTLDTIDAMHIGPLRFPGGHASSGYHWRNGTGPLHRRPHLHEAMFRFPDGMRYDFGTDEYLAMCRDLKIIPQITVNIGSGSCEEAAEWAAYCWNWWTGQGLEPPTMYWQIGNETYLAQEVGNCTPEMYVEVLRDFVPPIRKAYPKARIIAIASEGCSNLDPGWKPWRTIVLDQAQPDLYDLIDVHAYTGVPHDAAGPARQEAVVAAAAGMAANVTRAAADLASRGLDKLGKTVAITEWNMWHWATHHDNKGFYERYDVEHAMFSAMMVHHWARLGRQLELANFYNLLNVMGIILAKGPQFLVTPVADMFKLYRPAFGGDVLAIQADGPAIAGGTSPAIDAVCLRNDSGTYALLVNRDASGAVDVKLPAKAAECVIMSGKNPLDETMTTTIAKAVGNTVLLPPLSIARIRMV